jgi:GNAT superfamily N-acetyltransferase
MMRFISKAVVPSEGYEIVTGHYELNSFPGCNQLCISNHANIYDAYRGKGHGKKQHLERLENAAGLGYGYIICTVRATNHAEIHILEANGWAHLDTFYNTETKMTIYIYGRKL